MWKLTPQIQLVGTIIFVVVCCEVVIKMRRLVENVYFCIARGCHPPQEVMDVVFSTWDMAGQEVYYATHQCFLSRNTLYLVVWNMEEGEKGVHHLQPWLLNIQVMGRSS